MLISPVTLTPQPLCVRCVISTPVTWNGAWWRRRYSTTAAAASRITVSAAPASPRHRRGRRGGSSGRPVRQIRSAVCAGVGRRGGGNPGTVLHEVRHRIGSPGLGRPGGTRGVGRPGRRGLAGPGVRRRIHGACMCRRVRGFDLGRQEGARVLRRRVGGFDFGRQERGARPRPAVARLRIGPCEPPAILAATGSTWPRLRTYSFAGQFICLCRNADATEPSSLPPNRVPRLDGTELPLMLIHRAMTNGTDRMMPGPSASAA